MTFFNKKKCFFWQKTWLPLVFLKQKVKQKIPELYFSKILGHFSLQIFDNNVVSLPKDSWNFDDFFVFFHNFAPKNDFFKNPRTLFFQNLQLKWLFFWQFFVIFFTFFDFLQLKLKLKGCIKFFAAKIEITQKFASNFHIFWFFAVKTF